MTNNQANAKFTVTGDTKQAVEALKKLIASGKLTEKELKKLGSSFKALSDEIGDGKKGRKKGFANQVAGLAFIIRTTFLFSLASVGIIAINKFKAAIGNAVRSVIDFELQLAEINTLLDATDSEFKQLELTVRGVFRKTPQNMDKVTRAAYDLVSAGIELNDLYNTLYLVSEAATAGLTDNSVAAKAAVKTLQVYQLNNEDLNRVLDYQFQTIKKGVLVYEEFGQNIGQILSPAKQLGVSLEEVHSSFAALTKALEPAIAATALSRAFDQLREKSEELKTLGIDVYDDVTGSFRGLEKVIGDIRYLIGNLGDEQRQVFYDVVNFDIRAARAITGLTQQYETLVETNKSMADALGSREKAFNKIMDTTDSRLKIAWNRIADMSRETWEGLVPALGALLDIISKIVAGYYVLIRLSYTLANASKSGFFGTIEKLEELYNEAIDLFELPENWYSQYKKLAEEIEKDSAESRKKSEQGEQFGPFMSADLAEKLLRVAEIQTEYDKTRKKDLKEMRMELMDYGFTAEQIVDLSENELNIQYEKLQNQKEWNKLVDEFYDLQVKLKIIGAEINDINLSHLDRTGVVLELMRYRLTKSQSLISKWQIILYEQGYDLNEIINLTYEEAKKLEQSLDNYNRKLKQYNDELDERMREARYALEYMFGYPVMDMFGSLIDETENFSDAFDNMLKEILRSIAKFLASKLIFSFLNFLTPGFGNTFFGIGQLLAPSTVPGAVTTGGFQGSPPAVNLQGTPRANVTIVQHINVDRFLPHSEESLRNFSIELNRLSIKEAGSIL